MGRRRRWGLMLPALLLTVLSVRLTCADPDPKPKPREWRQWSARGSFIAEVALDSPTGGIALDSPTAGGALASLTAVVALFFRKLFFF